MAVALLPAPPSHALDPAVLAMVARDLACHVRPGQVPPGTERRWVQLVATDEYDAWLIAWPVGAQLGLHDHGGSSAAVQVVAGALVERHREADTPGPDHERTLAAGALVTFGAAHVHAIGNVGSHEALSVHVYSPPLRHMSYFD